LSLYSEIDNKLKYFIYLTVKPEQNAVNGQFKEEINKILSSSKNIGNDNVNYVWSIIKITETWNKMKFVSEIEENVIKEDNPNKREIYIISFEKLVGKKFRTYSDLIRYIKKLAEHFRDHLMKHAAVFANEILDKLSSSKFESFVNYGNFFINDFENEKYFGHRKINQK
jgi:hypothetical protein